MPTKTPQEEIKPANVDYTLIGEEERKNNSKKHIKILMPNEKMITGFVLVIMVILAITALNFPFNSFLMGTQGVSASIGYPFAFLIINTSQESNLDVVSLILDLLIYLIIAYIINTFLNLLGNLPHFKTKEAAGESPSVYKDQKITTTDRIAEKVSQ